MQWIWGIGVGTLAAIRLAQILGSAIVIGESISEGNRVVKDVTSTSPLLHPSSWLLQSIKASSEIEMNRYMNNHNLPRFQM